MRQKWLLDYWMNSEIKEVQGENRYSCFTRLKWKFVEWYLEVKLMRQLWYRLDGEAIGNQGTPVSGQWQARARAITIDQMTKSETPVAICYVKNIVALVSISNSWLLSHIIFKSSDSMVIIPYFECYYWWSNEPFLFSSWYPAIMPGKKEHSLGLCCYFRLQSYWNKGPYAKLCTTFPWCLVSYASGTAKLFVTFGWDNLEKLLSKIFCLYQNLDLCWMFCAFDVSSFMNLREM